MRPADEEAFRAAPFGWQEDVVLRVFVDDIHLQQVDQLASQRSARDALKRTAEISSSSKSPTHLSSQAIQEEGFAQISVENMRPQR